MIFVGLGMMLTGTSIVLLSIIGIIIDALRVPSAAIYDLFMRLIR